MTKEPDEDLIEATIRRVAEAKAARLTGGPAPDDAAEIESVPAPPATPEPAVNAVPSVEEDRIAETIRRVAEAKAARAAESRPVAAEEPAAPPAPRPAVAEKPLPPPAARPIGNPVPAPALQPAVVATSKPRAADDGWAEAVAELRRELTETQRKLRALSERFEASLARVAEPQSARPVAVEAPDDDGDWDDAPPLPRIPMGQPLRPAILRDPSPQTATAAHLEPEPETIIDTRPLPKPLPPLHAEPKRGLDLLPRTYRITVEDKRRGVDLVPLHRALLGMDGVRDMSLLSYSNGVAIVAVDMVDELEPQMLEGAISRAMARGAKVEVHNDTTMVVKLAEE
ncbi:MAG: hypothetical protein EPO22_01125 [Dehalococcoidia bacterium]|nr:MAG: hypothetical protein EPO22_01125 [Dehalococcoidia bacterium]